MQSLTSGLGNSSNVNKGTINPQQVKRVFDFETQSPFRKLVVDYTFGTRSTKSFPECNY